MGKLVQAMHLGRLSKMDFEYEVMETFKGTSGEAVVCTT